MISLPQRTQAIYAKIGGAPSTRNPTFHALGRFGVLNGSTPVKLASGGGQVVDLEGDDIRIFNDDTAPVVLTIYVRDGAAERNLDVQTLAVGAAWTLDSLTEKGGLIGAVTNGDDHDHSGGDGAQVDHGSLGGLGDVADHPGYALLATGRPFTGAQTFQALVTMTLGFNLGAGVRAANVVALEEAYQAGELDTEAKIITALNATNAALNDVIALLITHTLMAAPA